MVRFCDCDELLVHGERVPAPELHDCTYCRERASLVPVAAKIANELGGSGTGWTHHFAEAMEELVKRCL
jgi:hypothetical protein